jgi:hypothetical protein
VLCVAALLTTSQIGKFCFGLDCFLDCWILCSTTRYRYMWLHSMTLIFLNYLVSYLFVCVSVLHRLNHVVVEESVL